MRLIIIIENKDDDVDNDLNNVVMIMMFIDGNSVYVDVEERKIFLRYFIVVKV